MNKKERQAYKEKLEKKKRKRKAACKHKNTKKEYMLGMDTGDKICLDCEKVI
jgi:hypothetical protein